MYRAVPVHTPSLTQALSVAIARDIMVWREAETGMPYSAKELFEFALRQDREHPLTGHQYYMVTCEGAIGISPGLEWMTTWMFVPMEDCQERDFMLMKMREDLQAERDASEAEEQAAAAPPPPPVPPVPEFAGGGSPASTTQMNFCPNCGAKLVPGTKFCTQCGQLLIVN